MNKVDIIKGIGEGIDIEREIIDSNNDKDSNRYKWESGEGEKGMKIKRYSFYDLYQSRDKWLEAVEDHLYYSEEMGREMLELSDERIMWRLDRYEETAYNCLVEEMVSEMSKKYGTEIYLLGRSGRHVCVENTDKNRKRYNRMVKEVRDRQEYIIEEMNNIEEKQE